MRDKICIHRMRFQSRREIPSYIDFSERLVLSLGRRGQHDV